MRQVCARFRAALPHVELVSRRILQLFGLNRTPKRPSGKGEQ